MKDHDIRSHNREAWDRQVALNNRWTLPVDAQAIAAARRGRWQIVLTPSRPVPFEWFPELQGCAVLCLASGGGQQGPILAAAGAEVTVFDNSPAQLDQDRRVAERDRLSLRTVEGDMADLHTFKDSSFGLIIHPVSNIFVPDVMPVWKEAFRVLRPGGALLAGMTNPAVYLFDHHHLETTGELIIRFPLPYSDADVLSERELKSRLERGEPLEFSHTLGKLIGGQLEAGFVLSGFYEDRYPPGEDPLSDWFPAFFATRAVKPAEGGGHS